jgi:hypothetical protein
MVGSRSGETTTCAVDSWTTCEELANLAIQNHGVENSGWTITLWNQLEGNDAIVTETNGFDYVLDLVSEMELAPAFPAAKHMFLEQRKNSFPPIKKREVSRGRDEGGSGDGGGMREGGLVEMERRAVKWENGKRKIIRA